jgi:hypothetical protein
MAKNFLITLDPATSTSPGPFNIYYNTISDSNLVAASPSSATKASLLSGVNIIVSDDVNNIYLENLAEGCGNIKLVNVVPPTTTTTSTTTTTTAAPTTTTTTATPTTTTTTAAPTTTTTTAAPTTTTTTTTAAPTTTTTTATPTTTTTTCAEFCEYYNIFIHQTDINNAKDNTVIVDYYTCFGGGAITGSESYMSAGTYPSDVCISLNALVLEPDVYYYDPIPPYNKVTSTLSSGSASGLNCCE